MTLNLGIIGYGGMGEWHHRHTGEIKDLKIVAAYDIDPERAELAKQNALAWYNNAEFKAYHTLQDFLADGQIDAVLVAIPNDAHKDACLAVIAAGKHVLCEKPATLSVQELDEILAAAKKQKTLFTVHQNRRWDDDYRRVKASIAKNDLGKVFSIDTKLHGGGGMIHGWRAQKEHGGGMILDWGVHIIDQVLDLFTMPIETVYCQTLSVLNPDVDDFFKLIIKFNGGTIVQIEVGTFCLRGTFRTWHVCGDQGGLTVTATPEGVTGGVTKVRKMNHTWNTQIIETYAGPTRTFAPLPPEQLEELPLPTVNAPWSEFYENFAAAVAGKTSLIVKPEQIRRVIKVMEACFKSAESGDVVWFEE